MAKESLLQVRIDPKLKQEAETVFTGMGISVSEAVRMFLIKCVHERKLPFNPSIDRHSGELKAYGALNIFASPAKREQERDVWVSSLGRFGNGK